MFEDGVRIAEGLELERIARRIEQKERPLLARLTLEDDPEGSSEEEVALAESGHCAFSTGSRGCVGKNMAWLEMEIVLAKVIHGLEIRPDLENLTGAGGPTLSEGHREAGQYQLWDAFIAMRDGPFVQFREREQKV